VALIAKSANFSAEPGPERSRIVKEIKVGDHVVIHATKTGDHLTAAEVKIGATRMKGTTVTKPLMEACW
jgi:ribosomal protein L18E